MSRCQGWTKGSEWWIEMCLWGHFYPIRDEHCWAKRGAVSEKGWGVWGRQSLLVQNKAAGAQHNVPLWFGLCPPNTFWLKR